METRETANVGIKPTNFVRRPRKPARTIQPAEYAHYEMADIDAAVAESLLGVDGTIGGSRVA